MRTAQRKRIIHSTHKTTNKISQFGVKRSKNRYFLLTKNTCSDIIRTQQERLFFFVDWRDRHGTRRFFQYAPNL